jgi:hypothetical protein
MQTDLSSLSIPPAGESSLHTSPLHTQDTTCSLPDPPYLYRHNHVNAVSMDKSNCNVVRYQLDTQDHSPCKHTAFLAVRTRRLSLEEENPSEVEAAAADPEPYDNSYETDISQHETPNPLQRLARGVTQILSPKSSEKNSRR